MKTQTQKLVKAYGYESAEEMALDYMFDSTIPAICKNMHCHAIFEYEPDQDKGWCDECEENTVESLYHLIQII